METFVNDTVQLTVDTNIDVSGYATLQIRYRKPNGVTGCWAATICLTDNNCIYYICGIGDLDIPGEWLIQGVVLDVGVRLTGLWIAFQVHDPLMEFCTTVAPTTMVPTT
jgi:hypothetical protein